MYTTNYEKSSQSDIDGYLHNLVFTKYNIIYSQVQVFKCINLHGLRLGDCTKANHYALNCTCMYMPFLVNIYT